MGNKTSYVSLTSRLAIDLLKININKGDLNSDTIVTYRCGGYGYSSRSSGVARAPVRKSLIPPPSIEPLARPRKSAGFSVRHQRPVKCRARCPYFVSSANSRRTSISPAFSTTSVPSLNPSKTLRCILNLYNGFRRTEDAEKSRSSKIPRLANVCLKVWAVIHGSIGFLYFDVVDLIFRFLYFR